MDTWLFFVVLIVWCYSTDNTIVLLCNYRPFPLVVKGGGGMGCEREILGIQYHTCTCHFSSAVSTCQVSTHCVGFCLLLYCLFSVFLMSIPLLCLTVFLCPVYSPLNTLFSTPDFKSPFSFSSLWHNSFCPRLNWAIDARRWLLFTQPFRRHLANLSRWQIII